MNTSTDSLDHVVKIVQTGMSFGKVAVALHMPKGIALLAIRIIDATTHFRDQFLLEKVIVFVGDNGNTTFLLDTVIRTYQGYRQPGLFCFGQLGFLSSRVVSYVCRMHGQILGFSSAVIAMISPRIQKSISSLREGVTFDGVEVLLPSS
ncbi:hypothetical protein Tco_1530244 [Tanacetum coccineum]